jgi:hypothetical protein
MICWKSSRPDAPSGAPEEPRDHRLEGLREDPLPDRVGRDALRTDEREDEGVALAHGERGPPRERAYDSRRVAVSGEQGVALNGLAKPELVPTTLDGQAPEGLAASSVGPLADAVDLVTGDGERPPEAKGCQQGGPGPS